MQQSISGTGFYASDDESIIAWQTGDDISDYSQIQLYRLNSMSPYSISAASSEVVIPLGFMDNDVIYGVARVADVTTDYTGKTIIPMYAIRIQDQNENILKDYRQEGIYILDVEKSGNMLILSRVTKDPESGELVSAGDDQIVNNKTRSQLKNRLTSVVTEKMETTYQTALYKGDDDTKSSVKVTNPKEVVFEGSRDVTINDEDTLRRYYVYAKGEITGIYTVAADAVTEASELHGVVTNKQMAYVWESGNRQTSATVEGLDTGGGTSPSSSEGEGEEDTGSAYVKCIDLMLQSGGVYKSSEEEIRRKSLVGVLSDNLDADVLDLTGCPLRDVLYYISRGYPVMAMTGQGSAVLITGYDGKNTILYDPKENRTYKYGMNDSKSLFERSGNRFITYIQ